MTKRVQLIFGSLLVLFVVVGFSFFYYFQPTLYTPPRPADFQLRIQDGEIVGRESGEVRWRLFVQEMEEMKEDLMVFTDGTYGEFYRQGEVEYTIVSDVIYFHVPTGDLEFVDSVVLETSEGDRLESHLLLWDEERKVLSSPGSVQLFMGEKRLEAERMSIYQEDDIFDFWDQVVLSVPTSGQGRGQGEEEDD